MGLLKAVAEIINKEVKTLIAEGCKYIQLDNPHYPDYIVDDRRDQWRAIGIDPDAGDARGRRGRQRLHRRCRPRRRHVRHALLPRQRRPRRLAHRGRLRPHRRDVFGGLDYDRLLLEYDTERAGSFEPLRYVPSGKIVVMGL